MINYKYGDVFKHHFFNKVAYFFTAKKKEASARGEPSSRGERAGTAVREVTAQGLDLGKDIGFY